jgi:hypothetical protein
MSWQRAAMADALTTVLSAATGVSVFPSPPATFNPPAIVVNFPTTVTKHVPAFAIDSATVTLLCATGVAEAEALDQLLETTSAALETDQTLSGAVQLIKPNTWQSWRVLNVAGVEMLAAEISCEVRM